MPPPPVSVQAVQSADIPMTFVYAARVSDSRQVEVRARVGGILQKRAYVEGSYVRQGDLLFVIDPAPMRADAEAANAQLAQAKAAAAQAERDAERAEEVFAKGVISARDRDLAVSLRDQARAALARAKAEADRRNIDLGYTRVVAPVSGITSIGAKPEGSYVSTQMDETLLTTITQIDPAIVDFSVSEGDMMKLRALTSSGRLVGPRPGQGKARLVLNNGEPYAQAGQVEYLDVVLDRTTGSLLGRAQFPNPGQQLLPGMFVRLVLEGYTLKNAIVVPEKVIMQGPDGAFIFVLGKDSKAEARPVTLGLPVPGGRAIDSGLKSGEKIIVDNLVAVHPGAEVKVEPLPGAAPAAGDKAATGAKAPASDAKSGG